MKNSVLAMLTLVAVAAPVSPAFAGAKSDKVAISYAAAGQKETDCKISIKEINKEEGNVCIKLISESNTEELVPSVLLQLANDSSAHKGVLTIKYEGKDANNLIKTLTAWLEFLAGSDKYAAAAQGWTVSLVSSDDESAVVKFENPQTAEVINLTVELEADLK